MRARPTRWLSVTVRAATSCVADLLSALLFEAAANGIEELEPDEQGRPGLRAYFPPDAWPVDALPLVKAGGVVTSSRTVRRRNWEEVWREGLEPVPFGERLAVCPKGTTPPAGRAPLWLDPGAAFGSGIHATTRLAGALLERALTPHASALDVGTGSGVLAIAAALLGAAPVVGIDHDPVAVEEARRNAARNGLAGRVSISGTRLEKIAETFAVVVANLDAPTLRQVGPDLAARVAPGGSLVVSGLRRSEAWDAPPGWTRVDTTSEDAWIAERWERLRLPGLTRNGEDASCAQRTLTYAELCAAFPVRRDSSRELEGER